MSCDLALQAHTQEVSFQPTKHQNNYQILRFLKLLNMEGAFEVFFFPFLIFT